MLLIQTIDNKIIVSEGIGGPPLVVIVDDGTFKDSFRITVAVVSEINKQSEEE